MQIEVRLCGGGAVNGALRRVAIWKSEEGRRIQLPFAHRFPLNTTLVNRDNKQGE